MKEHRPMSFVVIQPLSIVEIVEQLANEQAKSHIHYCCLNASTWKIHCMSFSLYFWGNLTQNLVCYFLSLTAREIAKQRYVGADTGIVATAIV